MKKYVLDASVVVGFLLKENQAFDQLFKEIKMERKSGKAMVSSSPLLVSEVANALRYKIISGVEAKDLYESFLKLGIENYLLNSLDWCDILTQSYELGTAVYDTSYHKVAKLLGATLFTGDKVYYQKAKDLGSIELIS